MRSLSSSLSTEIAKDTGGAFRWLVQIRAMGWGTRYLAADTRTITNSYVGQIIDLSPMYEAVGSLTDLSVEVSDNADNRAVCRVGARADLLLWPTAGSESDADTTFKGEINGPIDISGGTIRFDAVSWARRHLDREIGKRLSIDDYAGADPDAIGRVKPVGYGALSGVPCLPVDAGSLSTLTDDITFSETTIDLTDSSAFPSSGTVQIDYEQITYTGNADNQLTGCTRGTNSTTAVVHSTGAVVAEIQTTYDYLVFDHPCRQMADVYVDGVRQSGVSGTLDGAISATDTTITLADGTDFNTGGSVKIESEWITYTGKSTNDLTGCTRGANGSTAASHADTTAVTGWPFAPLNDDSDISLIRWYTLPVIFKESNIDTVDTIAVSDPGHSHSTSGGGTTSVSYTGCGGDSDCSNCGNGEDNNTTTFARNDDGRCDYYYSIGTSTTGKRPTSINITIKADLFSGNLSKSLNLNGQSLGTGSQFNAAPSNTRTVNISCSQWSQVTTMSFYANDLWYIYEITINSVSWVYTDVGSAPAGVEKSGTVSISGNSVSDTKIGNVSVDVEAWADDSAGTITGISNSLIERPDHIMRHLLREYGAATDAETAAADFDPFTGDALAIIIDNVSQLRAVRDAVDLQARAITAYSGDRWIMRRRPDAGGGIDVTLTESDILRGEDGASSIQIGRAGLDRITNRWLWQAGQYPGGSWSLAGAQDSAYSQTAYGIREVAIDLPFVFDSTQAATILSWFASRDATPERRVVSAIVTLAAYAVELGDVVRIDHTDGTDVRGEVIGISARALTGGSNGSMRIVLDEIAAPAVEAVEWTSLVDCTATGNDLQRTTGSGAWNAGGVSTKSISTGDGWCSFTMQDLEGLHACGLSNGDSDGTLADIDFAWAINADVGYIYENLVGPKATHNLALGDVLYVRVHNGTITYICNDELIYTSAASPVFPLSVDASINSDQETLYDVYISGNLQPFERAAAIVGSGTVSSTGAVV